MCSRTLMWCYNPRQRGVGAPHQCPLGKIAMLPFLYTDVRSILMVFCWDSKAPALALSPTAMVAVAL